VLFGWKKTEQKKLAKGDWTDLLRKLRIFPQDDSLPTAIHFEDVSLAPSIQSLSLQIEPGNWVVLSGNDDFAKALFCDLCFNYIQPELGKVSPSMKGSDVSFLGRSNTTYGRTLIDHLSCGVKLNAKELLEFVAKNVLSERFRRHLSKSNLLEFAEGKKSQDIDLDERDFLEIAEANLLLQRRKAAVIDTTSDFYQIALEQGFQHSDVFLKSGKTLIWILDDKHQQEYQCWSEKKHEAKKITLYFPSGSRAGYIN
jgi:hypothetical protein